jgi:hypothetical protein
VAEFLITERQDGASREEFDVAEGVRGLTPGVVMATTGTPGTVAPYKPGQVVVGVFYRWTDALPGRRAATLIVRDAGVWTAVLKGADRAALAQLADRKVLNASVVGAVSSPTRKK